MVAAPILAFVTTHILYLNFYELDKGNLGHDRWYLHSWHYKNSGIVSAHFVFLPALSM
jgi:hypothetical protein